MEQKLRPMYANCQINNRSTSLKCLLILSVSQFQQIIIFEYWVLTVETSRPHIRCWKDSQFDNTTSLNVTKLFRQHWGKATWRLPRNNVQRLLDWDNSKNQGQHESMHRAAPGRMSGSSSHECWVCAGSSCGTPDLQRAPQ